MVEFTEHPQSPSKYIYISKENPALYIPVFSKEMRTGEKRKEKKIKFGPFISKNLSVHV